MIKIKLLRRSIFAVYAVLAASNSVAQTPVPAELEPWRDWVLYGEEFRRCPVFNGARPGERGNHVCAWPGALVIDAGLNGAQFEQIWTLFDNAWAELPGDARYWPVGVAVDGVPQAVVARAARPAIRLEPGSHTISGAFEWTSRPASIAVPSALGLVDLRLDGVAIANPELEDGQLWLGLRDGGQREQDTLDISVYRLLSDGLPIRLETVMELDVSGQSRETALAGALPNGFVGERIDSPLPTRLDPDGTLRVQLRPGTWTVTLEAHAEGLFETVSRAEATEPWPMDEVWSYETAPRLRVTSLDGVDGIDAERAGVPAQWLSFPAYLVGSGQSMNIVERSRNDAAEANRLSLNRDLWLDFDGSGYTVLDEIKGSMGNGWRLDMAEPYVMTMARSGNDNLLVTTGLEPGLQGVEVRERSPHIQATARLPAEATLAVSGYAERFDRIDATLHLPPAYRLLAAPGADRAFGAWLESWRLLDLFLVLIISAAAWRLFGAGPGIVAFVALVLAFHEPLAPRWAWLNVLLAIALARVAPEGQLRTFANRYRILSLVAVVLLVIPFLVSELRVVIYPQLERPLLQRSTPTVMFEQGFGAEPSSAPEETRLDDALAEIAVTARQLEPAPLSRYQPGALVQTGPGLPDWVWNRYELSWAGPIEAAQRYRLIVLSPWPLALWRVASVIAVLAFLAILVGVSFRLPPGWIRRGTGAGAILLAAFVLPNLGRAQTLSEFPSAELLDALKARLTEPAPCHPQCAELTSAAVSIDDADLSVDLRLAAQDIIAVPLPAASRGWQPQSVGVDGVERRLLYRSTDGRTWLRLEPGVHDIALSGALAAVDSLALDFSLIPHAIDVSAPGWDSAGISERRLVSGALELVRQRDAEAEGAALPATVFPPYVRVRRNISVDLDGQVRTVVQRVAPEGNAFTLEIDLLPNESVVTAGVEVNEGRALVAFAANQQQLVWDSRLPLADSLSLTTPENVPWSESWLFTVSHIWHAEYDGLPASPPGIRDEGFFMPEYYPRPGESLTVNLSRPLPASGDTIAIDAVEYERFAGDRSSESMLHFEYRSTQGGEHTITLPADSELDSVRIDGESVPLELDGPQLEIQITPGEHEVDVEWRDMLGARFVTTLPAVDLGGGASNIYSRVALPQDRWVLISYGPTLGPAILYWAELVVFVLAALLLGRVALSPLKTHEWLLLGLGLSTFAWLVLFLFAVWAFIMSWRQRTTLDLERRSYNLMQVGLAVLTVAALLSLIGAIPTGLLGLPDMQISSPVRGDGPLNWFNDRSAGLTDRIGVVSVSLWFYKAAMLAWSLWLSFALLRWLRWAWSVYTIEGLWRGKVVAGDAS